MVFYYNNVAVHYQWHGEVSQCPCLCLHGWGCSGEIFEGFINQFSNKSFITVDFPPFGDSQTDISEWNIFTYASMLMSLCEHLHIHQCDILGHSFGGRVAILLGALKKAMVRSLILVDAAGLKPKRSISYYYRLYRYKLLRYFGFYVSDAGSKDYRALSPQMQKVFVSVVNQHLDEYCPQISAKTCIIFGQNDQDTPIYMAKKLHKYIRNSELIILKDAGHFSFLDSPLTFYQQVERFWEGV